MTDFYTISTEIWKVRLPSDWAERESSVQDAPYFESADGTKGAYFSAWCIEDDSRSAREILELNQRVEVGALHEMKDSAWQPMDVWSSETPELSVLGADFLDRHACYRIVSHQIACLPWLVHSAFHDYDCAYFDNSKRFFLPIIDSLQIHT